MQLYLPFHPPSNAILIALALQISRFLFLAAIVIAQGDSVNTVGTYIEFTNRRYTCPNQKQSQLHNIHQLTSYNLSAKLLAVLGEYLKDIL